MTETATAAANPAEESKPKKCPHCGGEIFLGLVSGLKQKSRIRFSMKPAHGELLNAKTVGGCIGEVEKLLVACAKDQGVKSEILVDNITTENSEIIVSLLITRFKGMENSQP